MQQLRDDAGDDVLRRACAHNHLVWAERQAVASGGEVLTQQGLGDIRALRMGGPRPQVLGAILDEPGPGTPTAIDELIDLADRIGASMLSLWVVREAHGRMLDLRLAARGGRRGGRPHWMVLDCHGGREPPPAAVISEITGFTTPANFDGHVEPELHCYHPELSTAWQQMTVPRPQRVWHAVQWRLGRPVGQVSINVTEGELGVVGLHDAVFVPAARIPGPGFDRFDFFIRFALDLGSRYMVINAADRTTTLYRALGFRSLGHGQTWWFPSDVLRTRPSDTEIDFAEAVGLGDLARITPRQRDIDTPLANGMTPLQFAAATGQPDSADWLLKHGARPDLLALWDLGRRDHAEQLLQTTPGLVHRRGPRSGKTLLHRAVERDDAELAAVLVAAGASLSARDDEFAATPLTWAIELRRPQVAAVLRRSGARG